MHTQYLTQKNPPIVIGGKTYKPAKVPFKRMIQQAVDTTDLPGWLCGAASVDPQPLAEDI